MARLRSILVLAAVYYLTARLGLHLAVVHPYASAVWAPSGIALASLLLYGRSLWPGVLLGAFFANLANGGHPAVAAAIAAGNTLEALAGATLAFRYAGGLSAFHRASGVFRFAILTAGLSALAGAAIGVFTLTFAGLVRAHDALPTAGTWWIGDAAGDLIVAPFLILWRLDNRTRWTRAHTYEAVIAAAAAVVLAFASFTDVLAPDQPGLTLAFLCAPALLWPAFRLGLPETATTLALVDTVAVWAWYYAAPADPMLRVLQAYIGVTSVMLLAIAAEMAHGRRQQQELRLVTDDAPVCLAHCDREGRYRFVNRTYAARFGLEPEALIGRRVADVIGEEGYRLFAGFVETALSGRRVEFEIEAPYQSLGRRVMRCSYVPEFAPGGAPAGFISAGLDVTGQHRAETRLRQEYALRQAIENSMLTGITAVDSEGRLTYTNPAFCRMVGYSAEELIGTSAPFPYWPAEDVHRIQDAFQQTLRGEAPQSGYTLRFQRRDGERFDALVMVSSVRIGDEPASWLASVADISEHQRLHERIKNQEELLRLVIDGMPGLVAYIDRDYRYRFVNRGYAEWFRRPGSEIEGRTILEFRGSQWFDDIRPHLDRALAGETVVYERVIDYTDRPRTVRATYVPDRAADASIRGLVVLVEDITAEAAALDALRDSEEKFRHIVQNATEGIWIVDPAAVTTFVNDRMCRMLGYQHAELIGRCCFDFVHPDDRPRGLSGFERRKVGDTRPREYRVFRKDGQMIWIQFSGAPLRDANGALAGVLGVCTDLTARKYNEARYQTLFETTQDGVLIVDDRGLYVDVNNAFCALLKRTRDELIGSPFAPHIPPDRRAEGEAAFATLIATGHYEGAFPLLAADGSLVELEWHSAGNFVPGLHCCLARDVRERNRFEQQLQQTQKLESLGVMAGGVAHDFNNLLVGILANASLALEASHDPSLQPMLQEVVTAGERAAGLVRQMLAYAGEGRIAASAIDIGKLIAETATLVRASIPKTVALELELAGRLPRVQADPAQLQQVIMNMMINAAEAIPEDCPGAVTVATSVRPLSESDRERSIIPIELTGQEYVEVRFTDTGSGIPPGVQRKIFDPFFTTKFTGRGLGLSAVLGIVRSHGGALTLESAAGQGTTFRILLPATHAAADVPASTTPADAAGTASILVVDDEETVRLIVRRALERRGYTVWTAAGGPQAIALLDAHPEIAAVVLDLAMPAMTGDQVAPLLHARRPGLPIILSSGYAEADAARRFPDGLLAGFLQKPYTAQALAEKVASVLRSRAAAI
jgi:PAS domain S-box-containing protein